MEHHRRHVFVWRILRPLMRLLGRLLFAFRGEQARVEGPFLLLSNHVTDWDPMLVGCSFSTQMYFVTSEHLLRSGFGGRLVRFLQDPIPRQKGGAAADTVLTVMRRLKKGYSVAIFPEGNRTWDGVTQGFAPATGKLARSCGASLVTYRMEGGYFASPRWAGASRRRGKMRGAVVRVYAPSELRSMTPAQINDCIRRDLYEDAYARQQQEQIPFKGRRLAERLETLLAICPKCGAVGAFHSQDDRVTCGGCGFGFRYLPTGFLAGEALPWDNLRDWNAWQQEDIRRRCDQALDAPIFTDTDMSASDVVFSQGLIPVGRGELRLYRDRLELPGVTLPLSELTGVSLRGPQDIYFGTAEHHYLVRSDAVRCTVKYLTACRYLSGADYGV